MKAVLSTALAAVIGTILLIGPQPSWGQGKQIPSQTAQPGSTQDFSRARWMPPLATVAGLPTASTVPNRVYIVTNGADESDCTTGSGSSRVWCQAISGTWTAIGGGGGGGGTVSSIATTSPIGGGTITTTGTITCTTCATAAGTLTSTAIMTGAGTKATQTPSATSTLDGSGNMALAGALAATGVSTGASPPTCAPGTAGVLCLKEGTAPTGEASVAEIYSKTDHLLYTKLNNGSETAICTLASGCGTVTVLDKMFAGVCQNTVASFGLSWGTANQPSPACFTGTNVTGATLDFDDSGDVVWGTFDLPASSLPTITATIGVSSASTSQSIAPRIYTACIATTETMDPTFNAAQSLAATTSGSANFETTVSVTLTTTGCAAGERLVFKIDRNASSTFRLNWVRFQG